MLLRKYVAPLIIWFVYSVWRLSWRIKLDEPKELQNALASGKPFILAHFHGDELALVWTAKRYRAATIVSQSKDGEMMNTLFQLLGGKTSRGSSSRGGAAALKGLIRLAKSGWNASFAVDGPKGPIHKAKPGVFEFSRLTGCPIYVSGIACSSAIHFPKSWNKTYIPKPFAQVRIVWLGPIEAISKATDPRSEKLAKSLEDQLFAARRQARKQIEVNNARC